MPTNPYSLKHSAATRCSRATRPFKPSKRPKNYLKLYRFSVANGPTPPLWCRAALSPCPWPATLSIAAIFCRNFRKWYEDRVLGCPLSQWRQIESWDALLVWLDQSPAYRDSDLGFFIRYGLDLGLDTLGRGHDTFISYGGPDVPNRQRVRPVKGNHLRSAPAFYSPEGLIPLHPDKISEDIACSYFEDDPSIRHPFDGQTIPGDPDTGGKKYSWAKAPRYDGRPAETGALADMLVADQPLFVEQVRSKGANVLIRELARLVRPINLLLAIDRWLAEMTE